MTEFLLYERNENIEWITLNNPQKLNSLYRSTVRELGSHLREISTDEQLATVIITGMGEKSFCAGMNVDEFNGLTPQSARELMEELKELLQIVRTMPQAVIVAINGYCIGAAMELAMAADLRIASKNAMFAMPEINLGIPSVLDSVLLQQHVGLSLAKEMLLIGESVSVDRINDYGFINKVVELGNLRDEAEAYARRISENDRKTVATQKQLFETWQNSSLDIAIKDSIDQFALSFTTDVPQKRLNEFHASKKK
ncbi:enoyl-CoA hydratase/isomerase family protein [Salicibibacter halophilus]|uniref:Enoyl-CoA hydratase/isomerase family protein n=1 Tax=Salicibibacter halophilus TaxID=2502791 RepID=A0A514LFK1_9BACI|nr:enoyl-CoA hydratase/isomerase family protein [Salicibibacter halophilus]QDI90335.1 enoyl-CoA hydratase/isomerase family protein [Salicibibacter halophilus]